MTSLDPIIERLIGWEAFWCMGHNTFESDLCHEIERQVNGEIWVQISDEIHHKILSRRHYTA
jgi:hypothetical protein